MPRKSITPSHSELNASPGGVAAVDRALSLLAAFRAGEEPLSLAQLAQRTGLHKSTALRLLASLEHSLLIERSDRGHYSLGRGVQHLHQVFQSNSSLEQAVMPALRKLVERTGESAALHARWGGLDNPQRISLFRVDSPRPIRDHHLVGDILPMTGGTGARVLMAFDPELSTHQSESLTKLLKLIRKRGFHAAIGDRDPEVAGISAPVFKRAAGERILVGALVLTMPASRYDEKHIAVLVDAAREISSALGFTEA
jgi:DNA-binding IclR family transcriptional regulator